VKLAPRTALLVDCGAVAVIAAAVYALHGFDDHLDRDLALFVYGGDRVAHGVPPYVGSFNTVGPLADVVPGIGIGLGHLVGVGPVLSSRILFWLLSAACCVLVQLLGRQITGTRTGGFLAAALFLPFGAFLVLATGGPREKTLMVLLLVAGLLALCRRRWLAAGVLTGLATLTWQPALLPMLAAALAAAVLSPAPWRAGIRYLVGGLGTALLAAAAFALAGALHRALDGFVVANLLWVHQPSAFGAPVSTWHLLWHGYHATLFVALLGPVVLLVAARHRRPPVVLTAAAGLVAVAWTAGVINGGPDLFVVLPFGAVGTALLVQAVVSRVRVGAPAAASVLVAAVCAAAVLGAGVTAVRTRHNALSVQAADVHAVLNSVPPTAAVATLDAPQPLVLTGRTNPTPYLILDTGEIGYLDHKVPGGTTGFLQSMVRSDTALVAVGRGPDQRLIARILSSGYLPAGHGPGWEWWVARGLGARARQRVHSANLRVLHAHRFGCGERPCPA
jgi:hypothetical protein